MNFSSILAIDSPYTLAPPDVLLEAGRLSRKKSTLLEAETVLLFSDEKPVLNLLSQMLLARLCTLSDLQAVLCRH